DVLLREGQVRLLGKFVKEASLGQSLCHQMIMGAGKTTVVAPLLALLLATGDRLVCSCMPSALLEMSRSVLIERFSSPVLPKTVITLRFDRATLPSSALCEKLATAERRGAALVATPTALKSVLLKLCCRRNNNDNKNNNKSCTRNNCPQKCAAESCLRLK
ncbi:unnamed protein product, partial [Polarella glacialis]